MIGVPDAARELQLDLGVRAEGLLADGPPLQGRQVNAAQVNLPEPGERERQHDMVGADIADPAVMGETTGVSPYPAPPDGHQALPRCTAPSGSSPLRPEMTWSFPPRMCHFSSVPDSCGLPLGCTPLAALS